MLPCENVHQPPIAILHSNPNPWQNNTVQSIVESSLSKPISVWITFSIVCVIVEVIYVLDESSGNETSAIKNDQHEM